MKPQSEHHDLIREFTRKILAAALIFLMIVTVRTYHRWIKTSDLFHVRKVEIEGNDLLSDDRILSMVHESDKKSIWETDLQKIEDQIMSAGYVENACVVRKLPDVIHIEILEKKPLALLRHRNQIYCLDPDGQVLPSESGKMYDLPIVSCPLKGKIQINQKVGGKVKDGLAVLNWIQSDCPDLFPEISELIFGNRGLFMTTCRYGIPIYVGEELSLWKIRCFEAIFKELESQDELRNTEYIDLRYQGRIFVGRRI